MKTQIGFILLLGLLLLALPTAAIDLLVFATNDGGPGSLRQAIDDNNALGGGSTIFFSNIVTGTILLTNGELVISKDATILGPGANVLAVNGNAASRVFHISNAATVVIAGLSITNGAVSGSFPGDVGGGIWNFRSTLTLSNCTINGNSGGGIYSDGRQTGNSATLTVNNCAISGNSVHGGIWNDADSGGSATLSVNATTLSNNTAPGVGGGIFNDGDTGGNATLSVNASTFNGNSATGNASVGGGIFNDGNSGSVTATVSNCTFSGNSAMESGGAIYHSGVDSPNADLIVIGCTFSGNSVNEALGGGGIFIGNPPTKLEIGNTILKTGPSGANIVTASSGTMVITRGYNLCSDNGAGVLTNTTDQINTDPLLGLLADNGGPSLTHAPLSGSPAIDNGNGFGLTTDQRGAPRPFLNANSILPLGGDGSDIGAFEFGRPKLGIRQAGTNVVLSWPAYFGDFALESVTALLASNSWSAVTNLPAVSSDNRVVTESTSGLEKYYRLRAP
jgi:predicted outer membrane repeat protein